MRFFTWKPKQTKRLKTVTAKPTTALLPLPQSTLNTYSIEGQLHLIKLKNKFSAKKNNRRGSERLSDLPSVTQQRRKGGPRLKRHRSLRRSHQKALVCRPNSACYLFFVQLESCEYFLYFRQLKKDNFFNNYQKKNHIFDR